MIVETIIHGYVHHYNAGVASHKFKMQKGDRVVARLRLKR